LAGDSIRNGFSRILKKTRESPTSTLAVLKVTEKFSADPVNMILFHILMFSQNSTFYIYIIYCQNAPWSGRLVRTISLSKDGLNLSKEKIGRNLKKKTRSTEQIRLLFH